MINEKKFLISDKFLLLILCAAALLRFGFFIEIYNNPIHTCTAESEVFDQNHFYTLAQDLLNHYFIGSYPVKYSPGYAYIIAALFGLFSVNLKVVFVFQMLVGILATFVIYRAAVLLFQDKKVGLIAALIFAVYPPFIFYEHALLRASLIAYVNLFAFYILLLAIQKKKMQHFLLGGILTGLSMILRFNALIFFILPYLIIIFRKQLKKGAPFILVFLLGVAVPVAPIIARNYAVGKTAAISTYGPDVFWTGNSYDSAGIELYKTPYQEQLAKEAGGNPLTTLKILGREMQKHPKAYWNLYTRKIKMFFNSYEIAANLSYNLFKEKSAALKLGIINFGILSVLGLFGLFILWNTKSPPIRLLYLFCLVLSASVILFHIQSRYRIPAVPFFILFSAFSIKWIADLIVEKKFRALSAAAIFLLIAGIYVKTDKKITQKYYGSPVRCADYSNMALAYKIHLSDSKTLMSPTKKRRMLQEWLYYQRKTVNCQQSLSSLYDLAYIYQELGDQQAANHLYTQINRIKTLPGTTNTKRSQP